MGGGRAGSGGGRAAAGGGRIAASRPCVPLRLGPTLLVAGALLLPRIARAQVVVGTVTEAGTGTPVAGAFLTLVDPADLRYGAGLSRADGSFVLRPDAPGRFRLRVERIGYATVTSRPFVVTSVDSVRRDVVVPTEAISLEGIEVEGEARCGTGAPGGAATADLWAEARKALDVAAWAERSGYRYLVSRFARTLDVYGRPEGDSVRSEPAWQDEVFHGLDADSLAAAGYVHRDAGGQTYYGPDARGLLSDAFLRTHCFRAVRKEGRTGLAFEPTAGRSVPDIEGTLWFGHETAALEEVTYRYTGLPAGASDRRAGGRVTFARLPDGAWFVREWVVRMPRVAEARGAYGAVERRVTGIREQGGSVLDVRPAGGGGPGGPRSLRDPGASRPPTSR